MSWLGRGRLLGKGRLLGVERWGCQAGVLCCVPAVLLEAGGRWATKPTVPPGTAFASHHRSRSLHATVNTLRPRAHGLLPPSQPPTSNRLVFTIAPRRSRSLHATADIFQQLKANQDEPDPVTGE